MCDQVPKTAESPFFCISPGPGNFLLFLGGLVPLLPEKIFAMFFTFKQFSYVYTRILKSDPSFLRKSTNLIFETRGWYFLSAFPAADILRGFRRALEGPSPDPESLTLVHASAAAHGRHSG